MKLFDRSGLGLSLSTGVLQGILCLVVIVAFVAVLQADERDAVNGEAMRFQSVTVRPGDTLWSIANHYLKDPTRWNEILRHNKLPGSDPTVALPGMTLRVPIALIKEELRAAVLIEMSNSVLFRRKEKANWDPASLKMQLYRSDWLRTLASSEARVQFVNGELLSLNQNSMAILKPLNEQFDLRLERGEIQATRARVVTASAKIIPKADNTKYKAKIREDLSTRVEVYSGLAEVEGGGMKVEVKAGFASDVPLDRSPSVPQKLPELPQFTAQTPGAGQAPGVGLPDRGTGTAPLPKGAAGLPEVTQINSDAASLQLSLGAPVSGYHVQVSRTQDFRKIIFDKTYDADDSINLKRTDLPRGIYWVRVAVVDLLGSEGTFSEPKQYFKR